MPKILLLFILFIHSVSLSANDDYWQQKVDFNISVSLNAVNKTLEGEVQMLYQNNANQHLDTIWIHLWPNAYSRYNTALAKQLLENDNLNMDLLDREDLGAIGKLDFKVDSKMVEFHKLERDPDIGYIVLSSPLLPNETIEITTPFKVKVPASISRMGTEDGYFAITQWFPKPAVYDQDGWHAMPYLDQGEFYAEFGTYHVEITVPENYIVAATGKLTAENDLEGFKTLIYDQENIHDFAWFASPDFKVVTEKVRLPNGHEVDVNTYFITDEERWQEAHQFTRKSLLLFSDLIGPYPYSHCTVVEGPLKAGGGMEYPMITILDDYGDKTYLESVISHEVAHNWWQGILASNERADPWIDEGFTSYYEKRYNNEHALNEYQPAKIVTERKVAKFFGLDEVTYESGEKILLQQIENRNKQQAVGLHATKFTDANTYFSLYAKAPHQIIYLENYLGRDQFDACIQSFFEAYQFKHIHPTDIQNHFESCSGKDLDFFFQDWINTDGIVNGKIGKISKEGEHLKVEIKQTGEVVMPLPITIINEDGEQTVWVEGESTVIDVPSAGLKEIIVDKKNLSMDYQPADNFYKTNGIGKLEKIRPQLFFGLDNPKRTEVFFSPMMAGNAHDKFMLGLTVYNRFYPSKNLDWDITPLYAFGSKQVNGIFNLSYAQNIRKDRHVQLKYGIHFKTFSYNNQSFGGRYVSVEPNLKVTFLPNDRRKKIEHSLQWQHKHNWRQVNLSSRDGLDSITVYNPLWAEVLTYEFHKKDIKIPIDAKAQLIFNNDFLKSNLETKFKIRYGKINSYFSTRFFISFMTDQFISGLEGSNGRRDYFFDNYYLGRNVKEGFLSNQIVMDEGQFKVSSRPPTLPSSFLITSLNFRADFPSKWIPIKLYLDLGVVSSDILSSTFAYQAGAMLSLFNEALEVYFPFFSSNDIKDYYELNAPKFKQRISFSIDLNKINPHKIVEEFEL